MSDGWLVIKRAEFREMLRRAQAGEDPDLLDIEVYANSDVQHVEGDDL